MPSTLHTCSPIRSTSCGGMITTDQAARARGQHLVVDPVAGSRGEQLGVGQPGHLAAAAVGQHDGGHDQRAGAGAAAGLVGTGDRREAGALERLLVGVEAALAAHDEPRHALTCRTSRVIAPSLRRPARCVSRRTRRSAGWSNVRAGAGAGPVQRPDDGEGPADHVVDGHEALARLLLVGAAVLGDRPVVAHHPELALRARSTSNSSATGSSPGNRYGSSSGTPLTVTRPWSSQHATLSPPTPMTRLIRSSSPAAGASPTKTRASRISPTHARRAPRSSRLAQPAARVAEHDDVAAVDLVRLVGQLVDQHPVVDQQGVLHRPGRDVERLHEERLDEHRDDQRGDDDAGQLAQERLALRRHGGCAPATGGLAAGTAFVLATGARRRRLDRSGRRARTVLGRHRVRPSVPVGPAAPGGAERAGAKPPVGAGPVTEPVQRPDHDQHPADAPCRSARCRRRGRPGGRASPASRRGGRPSATADPAGTVDVEAQSDGTSPGIQVGALVAAACR